MSLDELYRIAYEHQRAGRLAEAERLLRLIVNSKPDHAGALHNLALIAFQSGKTSLSLELLHQCIQLEPGVASYCATLGELYRLTGQAEQAVHFGELAVKLQSGFVDALNNLGVAYSELEQTDRAISCFEKVIALDQTNGKAFNNLGNSLKEVGRLGEASMAYSRSLDLDPSMAETFFSYADVTQFEPDNSYLVVMEKLRSDNGSFNDSQKLHLDFALAKAYADLNNHKRSFEYLLSGNAIKRAQISYDEGLDDLMLSRIEAVFTKTLLSEKKGEIAGNSSALPIFILGMPRSGTTLVEQILASHPQVHGGGELSTFHKIATAASDRHARSLPYPDYVVDLDSASATKMAENYTTEIRKLSPTAVRITDKRPSNYYFVGLIDLVLPDAFIIHTARDPLDNCLSCFAKLFAVGQNHFAYDLQELGRQYQRYRKIMAHWRSVLRPERMLEIHYEDIVTDLEGQARRIVGHCGLDWDPRCLSFYATNRVVRTASAAQVRQPIYRSAVGRAQQYGKVLDSLKEAISDT